MTTGSLDEYDLWLLEAAAKGPSSIEELSNAGRVPKSTAYRRVPVLAGRGLLRSQKRDSGVGRPALVYTITDSGVEELRAFADGLRGTLDRLTQVISSLSQRPRRA
ncbi:MAG: helix-turn-helix transcriptional regulator [Acidimicrobiales bacterium]